jgi:hypothetical protein
MARPNCFGGGKKYLKADEVKSGDLLKFLTEGEETVSTKFQYPETTMASTPHPLRGQFKKQFEIKVSLGNGEERTLTLNKTSYTAIGDKLGYDTKDWINKIAKITIAPTPNGKKAIYLSIEE